MPLEKYPVITQNDVDTAANEQLGDAGRTFGVAAGLTAVNYRLNAPGGFLGQFLVKSFTGVNAKPTPTGRAAISVPPVALAAALLPSPVGFTPPEWLGLHPAVVHRTLGFGAGKKPVVFEPSETRTHVFEATIAAERIAARALRTEVIFGRASGHPFRDIPPGPIDVTPDELAFLQSLPAGLTPAQRLIPQLEARLSDLREPTLLPFIQRSILGPAFGPVLGALAPAPGVTTADVPSASIQPELIQPVSAAALANMAAAEGIRQALVSERADP